MRTRSSLTALLTAALAASTLAMAPVAIDDTGDDTSEPETLQSCADTGQAIDGATVVTPDTGFNGTVPTPVGAANNFETEDAGLYQLDLAGLEAGTTARVTMTLSWDTPGGFGDYDLVVNGSNEGKVESPETHIRTLSHCGAVDLDTIVFFGTPLDTLTLDVTASAS